MTTHPNAELAARLRNIECSLLDKDENATLREAADTIDNWVKCGSQVAVLNPGVILRIKPATVNIGGVELEGPVREASERGTKLWLLFDHTLASDMPISFSPQMPEHVWWLYQGRLFASKEARDKYQDALVKLANGETK